MIIVNFVYHLLPNNDLLNLVSWQIELQEAVFGFVRIFLLIFSFELNNGLFCQLHHRKNCFGLLYRCLLLLLSFSIEYLILIQGHSLFLFDAHQILHFICVELYFHFGFYSIFIHIVSTFIQAHFFIQRVFEYSFLLLFFLDYQDNYEWHRRVAHFFGLELKIYEKLVFSFSSQVHFVCQNQVLFYLMKEIHLYVI